MAFEHFNTKPPEELEQQTPPADNSQATPPAAEPTPASGTPPAETTPPPETKPDEFIENFNKRYSTQYKSDDEIKNLFSLPGKVTEYEGKLKDHDTVVKSAESYKKELEETKTTYLSDLLSKPRIRKAFIAEQLIGKYPDRDPDVLGEIAMTDVDKMSDIEVLARERKMRGSKSSLDNIKAVIIKELGVDPEQKPEEWDSLVTTELEMKATDARERIRQLLQGIELPKTVTQEEREALQAKALEEKVKAIAPIKEIFKKFDKFQSGDFEFVPPDEYKSKLEDVFNGMFINSGLEVNEENLATAETLKRALFVDEYFPKMLELHEKLIRTKVKEETEALLNNTTPPNTAAATDQTDQTDPNRPGLSNFFRDQNSQRVTKL